jgi:hypothetical protein
MSAFHPHLDRLVESYRSKPFEFWKSQYERGEEICDRATSDFTAPDWWQAETTVLEIQRAQDGRSYAHVAIFLCPWGVTSNPPGPTAGFLVYEDGAVSGTWADGTEFRTSSAGSASMTPNTSPERTRDR